MKARACGGASLFGFVLSSPLRYAAKRCKARTMIVAAKRTKIAKKRAGTRCTNAVKASRRFVENVWATARITIAMNAIQTASRTRWMKSRVGRSSQRLSIVFRYSKYREMNARNHMIAPTRTTLRTTRGR